jgi:hypothetical protein
MTVILPDEAMMNGTRWDRPVGFKIQAPDLETFFIGLIQMG